MRHVLTNTTAWEIIAELRVVKIRLRRVGRKHKPIYRVVVADSRSARDGAFIETIGHYNPLTDPSSIDINEEKALKWLNCGAQPTDTVYSLLRKLGIIDKFKQQQILNQN